MCSEIVKVAADQLYDNGLVILVTKGEENFFSRSIRRS
jgi:hypothetical protein